MPEFLITSPEGKQYRVMGPQGSTKDQALAHLQQRLGAPQEPLPAEPGYTTERGAAPSPRAQALKETILGTSTKPQPDLLATQEGVAKKLRAGGMSDADIEKNPEWQAAAKNTSRSVSSAVTSGAVGALEGEALAPVAKLAGKAVGRILPGATARATNVADIAAPETTSDLGQRMHDTLMHKFKDVRTARGNETGPLRDAFFGNKQSAQPIIDQYQSDLKMLLRDKGADLSSEERDLLQQSMAELREGKSVEAIDKERRRLNGIAQSGEMAGHGAIKKSFAETLSDKLTGAMERHNPDFASYIGKYRDMSEPINLYMKTGLGKAVTREAVDDVPATDIAQLPARFFKSRQSIETLKKLSGDDNFVEAASRIRAASELDRLTQGKPASEAARQAERWVLQNKGWLDAVPETQGAVTKYATNLRGTARTQKAAKVAAGGAAAALLYEEGGNAIYWIRHLMP